MSLKKRMFLTLSAFFAGLCIVTWVTVSAVMGHSYAKIEKQSALDDLARIENALTLKRTLLGRFIMEYADWEEAYDFMAGKRDDSFITNYLQEIMYENDVNYFAYLNGKDVHLVEAIDTTNGLPKEPKYFVDLNSPTWSKFLAGIQNDTWQNGIINSNQGLAIYVVIPVASTIHDDYVGHLLGVRKIDAAFEAEINRITNNTSQIRGGTDLGIHPLDNYSGAEHKGDIDPYIDVSIKTNDRSVISRRETRNVSDKLIYTVQSNSPRTITISGQRTVMFAVTILIGFLSLTLIVLIRLFSVKFVQPIATLTRTIKKGGSNDHMKNLSVKARNDEIGILFREFDSLVKKNIEYTDELTLALDAAEAATRSKSEFLANMSHEIRTPMNGVLGIAELLRKTELTAKQQSFTDTILSSGSALLTIINDILDFSKIEAGKLDLDPSPFNLRDTVEDVATLLAVVAHEKGIELSVRYPQSIPENVLGDASRIRQCLTNLIGNAVKFTHEGNVVINVTGRETDVGMAFSIAVEDTGIGIPPAKLETIFDQFTQAEASTTRQYGGTGLGLAITKNIIDAMGGDMVVTSTLGEGSIFEIRIELPTIECIENSHSNGDDFKNLTVVICDDNDLSRVILEEMLAEWGALPVVFKSCHELLEALRASDKNMNLSPDAFILDYKMPEMNGVTLLESIREIGGHERTPAIVLSSLSDMVMAHDCTTLGATEVLTKPAKSKHLATTLASVLGTKLATELRPSKPITKISPVCANQGNSTNRKKILIVDDNEVNRMVVGHMIDQNRYETVFAVNGREAYQEAKAQAFDLILMDISMPEMDGIEATKALRSFEALSERNASVVVALTAHAFADDKDRFISDGFDDYLSKPVGQEALAKMIDKWVHGAGETHVAVN